MNSDKFWAREALNKLTEVLTGAIGPPFPVQQNQPLPHPPFLEKWREFCIKHKIKPGAPDFYVKGAHYTDKSVADFYDFEEVPMYYDHKNTVVVLNPFFGQKSEEDFLRYKWLEIDAELAVRFLVLGLP
jgi:hypothetical protein